MAAADDKKVTAVQDYAQYTNFAEVPTCKNIIGTFGVNMPSDHPNVLPSHKCYDFFGFTTPDNTDYPDTVAPIGSTFRKFTVAAGVVTGATMYMKTAAATWTVYGSLA